MKRWGSSRLARLSLLTALAMILSFVESQIPALVAVPGVKVGLANIAVVFALYRLGCGPAALISLVRVVLVGLLFGNGISLLYSLAGAAVSLAVMVLLKRAQVFSPMAVSVAGGVLHNLGQLGMACLMTGAEVLRYYAPVLVLSGTVAGVVIGVLAGILLGRLPK